MGTYLAIMEDTWRQSKQQVVFILLLVVLVLCSAAFIGLPKTYTTQSGERILGVVGMENPESGLEQRWDTAYRAALLRERGAEDLLRDPQEKVADSMVNLQDLAQEADRLQKENADESQREAANQRLEVALRDTEAKQKALKEKLKALRDSTDKVIEERSSGISALQKGVEVWLSTAASWIFTLSLWGFIAACAGYFPGMLAGGAVDVLVSKPVYRYQLFFGKYLGGLVLYTMALVATYLLLFFGLGIRTGVWHFQFFSAMPLTLFSVALLFAIVGLIGVLTRSTALAMIIGYVYYFVIDSAVSLLQRLGDIPLAKQFESLQAISTTARWLFPGFGRLEAAVEAAVVNVPIFEGQPLMVGLAWLVTCLGIGYWRFYQADF